MGRFYTVSLGFPQSTNLLRDMFLCRFTWENVFCFAKKIISLMHLLADGRKGQYKGLSWISQTTTSEMRNILGHKKVVAKSEKLWKSLFFVQILLFRVKIEFRLGLRWMFFVSRAGLGKVVSTDFHGTSKTVSLVLNQTLFDLFSNYNKHTFTL